MNETLTDAIHSSRVHHQLAPMRIDYESKFDQSILQGLSDIGHVLHEAPSLDGFAAVGAISRNSVTGEISAVADARRKGTAALY